MAETRALGTGGPRLHYTTVCNRFDNQLNVCLHDAAGQTG